VERHVAMINDILALTPADLDLEGVEQTVVTELFFDKYIRERDLIAIGPYNYTGTLLGLEFGSEGPVVVFEHLRTELLAGMTDDGWEFEQKILVCVEDEARVPVRDIDAMQGLLLPQEPGNRLPGGLGSPTMKSSGTLDT